MLPPLAQATRAMLWISPRVPTARKASEGQEQGKSVRQEDARRHAEAA